MQEQLAIDAVVQACLNTWPATVKKAADAGYTFCIIGYFEIPDIEHSAFHQVLQPLLDDIDSKGAQALEFRPNMDGIYDKTGQTIVAYAQTPWNTPARRGQTAPGAQQVQLLSKEYIHTRDVTEDVDQTELVRGLAFAPAEVPTFRTHLAGESIVGAVGACWRNPRLT